MQVKYQGDVAEGRWHLVEGVNKRLRWEDNMRVPPKGQASATRAAVRRKGGGNPALIRAAGSCEAGPTASFGIIFWTDAPTHCSLR